MINTCRRPAPNPFDLKQTAPLSFAIKVRVVLALALDPTNVYFPSLSPQPSLFLFLFLSIYISSSVHFAAPLLQIIHPIFTIHLRLSLWEEHLVATKMISKRVHGHLKRISCSSTTFTLMDLEIGEPSPRMQVPTKFFLFSVLRDIIIRSLIIEY